MCVCVCLHVCVGFSLADWLMLQHMHYGELYLNGDSIVLRVVCSVWSGVWCVEWCVVCNVR